MVIKGQVLFSSNNRSTNSC